MNESMTQLELLLKDMRENPKRYVHFSLFGRKVQNLQKIQLNKVSCYGGF